MSADTSPRPLAVLLRDRRVRMGDPTEHAQDLGVLDAFEEVPWLLVTQATPPAGFVPGSEVESGGWSSTWEARLDGERLSVSAAGEELWSWRIDELPMDWRNAVLGRGSLSVMVRTSYPDTLEVPSALRELAASAHVAHLPLVLEGPRFAPARHAALWNKVREQVGTDRVGALNASLPPRINLPSSVIPDGYAPSLAQLIDAGFDLDDLAASTSYVHVESPSGRVHRKYDCPHVDPGAVVNGGSRSIQEVALNACSSCGPDINSPLTAWSDFDYQVKVVLAVVAANNELQKALERSRTVLEVLTQPQGGASRPGSGGYGLLLEISELGARVAQDLSTTRQGRNLAPQIEVLARSEDAAHSLGGALRQHRDRGAERALLALALGEHRLPLTHSISGEESLRSDFTDLVGRGADPLASTERLARQLMVNPRDVRPLFGYWLEHLDEVFTKGSQQLILVLIKERDGVAKTRAGALALLRYGRLNKPSESFTSQAFVTLPSIMADALKEAPGESAEEVGSLVLGDDPRELGRIADALGSDLNTYALKKELKAYRALNFLGATKGPVGWRDFDAAPVRQWS